MFRTIEVYGGLEVPPCSLKFALPERGDPEHVLALYEEHVGGVALAARVQLFAELPRSEEHTSELQSPDHLVCRLLLEKKKKNTKLINYEIKIENNKKH